MQRFSLKDFVIVADSGLMNAKNMKLLRSAGYKYIVGARIKTERTEVREFLEISKDVQVTISQEKIAEDVRWDGLKGYITNTSLDAEEVISQYHGLGVVEKAFRVSKGNLEMRPVFHFTERRIEAHVCICFIAYKVYKELERIIRISKINLSVDKVLDIAKTIATIDIKTDGVEGVSKRTLFLTQEQMAIKPLFDLRSLLDD